MAEKVYSFKEQMSVGAVGEHIVDWYLGEYAGCSLRLATDTEQARGIDRVVTAPHTVFGKHLFTVEVKTDTSADFTGNFWVETVSQEREGKFVDGWLWTCQADWLFYFFPTSTRLLQIAPDTLRHYAEKEKWSEHYPNRLVQNNSYVTTGCLIPLKRVYSLIEQIVYIKYLKNNPYHE